MHWVQTLIVFLVPSTIALTFFRLGRWVRPDTLVTLRPTPPSFFALPLLLTLLALLPPFPHISQTLATFTHLPFANTYFSLKFYFNIAPLALQVKDF